MHWKGDTNTKLVTPEVLFLDTNIIRATNNSTKKKTFFGRQNHIHMYTHRALNKHCGIRWVSERARAYVHVSKPLCCVWYDAETNTLTYVTQSTSEYIKRIKIFCFFAFFSLLSFFIFVDQCYMLKMAKRLYKHNTKTNTYM